LLKSIFTRIKYRKDEQIQYFFINQKKMRQSSSKSVFLKRFLARHTRTLVSLIVVCRCMLCDIKVCCCMLCDKKLYRCMLRDMKVCRRMLCDIKVCRCMLRDTQVCRYMLRDISKDLKKTQACHATYNDTFKQHVA
jgi:hypothetical protein